MFIFTSDKRLCKYDKHLTNVVGWFVCLLGFFFFFINKHVINFWVNCLTNVNSKPVCHTFGESDYVGPDRTVQVRLQSQAYICMPACYGKGKDGNGKEVEINK